MEHRALLLLVIFFLLINQVYAQKYQLESPDGRLEVQVENGDETIETNDDLYNMNSRSFQNKELTGVTMAKFNHIKVTNQASKLTSDTNCCTTVTSSVPCYHNIQANRGYNAICRLKRLHK